MFYITYVLCQVCSCNGFTSFSLSLSLHFVFMYFCSYFVCVCVFVCFIADCFGAIHIGWHRVQIASIKWTRMQYGFNVGSHSTNCVATKFRGRFVESSFSSESSSAMSSSSSMARRRDNDELLLLSSPSANCCCCCCWRKKCDSKKCVCQTEHKKSEEKKKTPIHLTKLYNFKLSSPKGANGTAQMVVEWIVFDLDLRALRMEHQTAEQHPKPSANCDSVALVNHVDRVARWNHLVIDRHQMYCQHLDSLILLRGN